MSDVTPQRAKSESVSPPKTGAGTEPGKKRSWVGTVLVVVGILVVCLVVRQIITGEAKPPPPLPPAQVSTVVARQGDMGVYADWAIGTVTPVATVTVPSQVTGQLTNVKFTEGQMVKAGDLLAEIDPRPFQAQVDAADGQLQKDTALLAEARINLTRYQEAYNQKAIPKQQLDDQSALVDQDGGTVKNDQGLLDSARVQLSYCRIRSPIDGRAGLRLVDAGNIVQSSSTNGLVVITQLQPITVLFSLNEDFLPQIQQQLQMGSQMSVRAYDRAQQTNLATGRVLALDNEVDIATGTVRLKAIFDNKDNALFPNQFVNAHLLIDTMHKQTLIPTSVIQRDGAATFVYVLNEDDNTVEMRSIKIVVTDGETTAASGVDPGEVLAADNFNRLEDGAKVTVRKMDDSKKKSKG